MDRVNGRDGRDDGIRYFPLIFLLFTSYFFLSFNFSSHSFLLFFQEILEGYGAV